ncbi:MAG: HAD-IA family hydrolase [Pirellulaceae bacterium]|nr:HAD-IA family hydrolase [Pirellulaceae bacterium]
MLRSPITLVFDAVGTLIRPRESISEVYQRFARDQGLELARATVKTRFASARQQIFSNAPDQPSSNEIEKQNWKTLIATVFPELPDTEQLFQGLWQYYSEAENWMLFPEVPRCLETWERRGSPIVIASNFDKRLIAICQQLEPLHRIEHIFCSSELGFSKPDVRFYREIERRLGRRLISPLMIGDDLEKDVHAAIKAGWQARHLDRSRADLTAVLQTEA